MYSPPEEIEAALKAYRSRISERNRRFVEVYSMSPEEGDLEDDEDISDLRLEAMHPIFDVSLSSFVSTPREILTRWDELCVVYDLQGTSPAGRNPSEEDVALNEAWVSLLEEYLKKRCKEDVRETLRFPEEFCDLARYVDNLAGPGLTEVKSRYQAGFLVGRYSDSPALAEQGAAEMVKTPEWFSEYIDCRWECAAGWDAGCGISPSFYVVYCRRRIYNVPQLFGTVLPRNAMPGYPE
ncbi:hypothetical protein BDP81DRAFT_317235 [Colletotrichum phormii]|uniref:Uncharacterized protein n=1 Tax=Colletotrichum phormii TaxID=359342 RepID=A0AAI9ZT15_9PEZI|nr:uncharacterized protein BDP81DRAFT_317235 [Colletotrichum phormii]KAK1637677.1 hypothetical protein BDP81DRAFT_317235 [Colletotrichum phormii]